MRIVATERIRKRKALYGQGALSDDTAGRMERMENCILFTTDEGEEVPFYVISQTTIAGEDYLLVTDSPEDDGETDAYIMREVQDEDDQLIYEMVEEEDRLEALSRVFGEQLEDVEIQR